MIAPVQKMAGQPQVRKYLKKLACKQLLSISSPVKVTLACRPAK
jgi:hypothetical protein